MNLANDAFSNHDFFRGSVFLAGAVLDAVLAIITLGDTAIASGMSREAEIAARGGPQLLRAIRTPTTLKDAVGNQGQILVNQALKGRTPLSHLTSAERAEGAKFFRNMAEQVKGPLREAAAAFNRLRADFLEGLTDEIPGNLRDFMARHGYDR